WPASKYEPGSPYGLPLGEPAPAAAAAAAGIPFIRLSNPVGSPFGRAGLTFWPPGASQDPAFADPCVSPALPPRPATHPPPRPRQGATPARPGAATPAGVAAPPRARRRHGHRRPLPLGLCRLHRRVRLAAGPRIPRAHRRVAPDRGVPPRPPGDHGRPGSDR